MPICDAAPQSNPAGDLSRFIQQLQGCNGYGFVGNDLAAMQKSGKLVIGSSEGYGEYDPWADKLIFASDVPLDPVTVVHEWRHHIQRKRLGFFVYKLVAVPNLIQGAIRGTQAGYMDDIAERDANHIVHDCKVR